jgi:hypothetical protein
VTKSYELRVGGTCRCLKTEVDGYWGAIVQSNGVRQIRIWWYDCGGCQTEALSHKAVRYHGREPDKVPVVRNRQANTLATMCHRCGQVGPIEQHHFAPWSLFDDAHDWPTAWLCPPCHREWHQKTGIADGRQK